MREAKRVAVTGRGSGDASLIMLDCGAGKRHLWEEIWRRVWRRLRGRHERWVRRDREALRVMGTLDVDVECGEGEQTNERVKQKQRRPISL